jgi:hypothetical protein
MHHPRWDVGMMFEHSGVWEVEKIIVHFANLENVMSHSI